MEDKRGSIKGPAGLSLPWRKMGYLYTYMMEGGGAEEASSFGSLLTSAAYRLSFPVYLLLSLSDTSHCSSLSASFSLLLSQSNNKYRNRQGANICRF